MNRYTRQLPIIGRDGQENLHRARVFIAGAGGLGTVISTYLCLAGVGSIIIADSDIVEESNFNRQFLHWTEDLGKRKIDSLEQKLSRMNPEVLIETRTDRIDANTVNDMVRGCNLIIDALDNFSTRYVLNRAALRETIPFIHGAVEGFYGQATTILPRRSPCLRCIFPQSPPARTTPVIGATCGIIGSVQATEAIKYLCGQGELLAGRLLLWDALRTEMNLVDVARNPSCRDCHLNE